MYNPVAAAASRSRGASARPSARPSKPASRATSRAASPKPKGALAGFENAVERGEDQGLEVLKDAMKIPPAAVRTTGQIVKSAGRGAGGLAQTLVGTGKAAARATKETVAGIGAIGAETAGLVADTTGALTEVTIDTIEPVVEAVGELGSVLDDITR